MTLVETMVSLTILLLIMGGLLATMIQSRRLTEGSIRRNMATNIATSFVEQIKGMDISSLVLNPIPTKDNDLSTGTDALNVSSGTPPSLSSLTPGITPANTATTTYADNLKDFPLYTNDTLSSGVASTWTTPASSAIWPGATTAGPATPYVNDLHLNIWVWVSDMNASNTNTAVAANTAFSVTVIYTWRVADGGRIRYFMDEVHCIISNVTAYGA